MEKTPKYDLSQWSRSDRILMEDFNRDNANLETALTALAAGQAAETARVNTELAKKAEASALNSAKSALEAEDKRLNSTKLEMVTILDKTYSVSNSATLSLPVGSLAGYAAVAVDLALPNMTTNVSVGSGDSAVSTSGGAYLNNSLAEIAGKSRLMLFPMKQAGAFITTTSYTENAGTYLGKSSVTYGGLRRFVLTFRTALTASVKVTITGIK